MRRFGSSRKANFSWKCLFDRRNHPKLEFLTVNRPELTDFKLKLLITQMGRTKAAMLRLVDVRRLLDVCIVTY